MASISSILPTNIMSLASCVILLLIDLAMSAHAADFLAMSYRDHTDFLTIIETTEADVPEGQVSSVATVTVDSRYSFRPTLDEPRH
jgi:hypothetical protein